jgi:transcriptional regulator with XRE-family HTH domain
MKSIGERLRLIRDSLGLTQKQMAEHVGIGASTWPKLENESRLPEDRVLRQLYDEGFDLNWLITGLGGMKVPTKPLVIAGGKPGIINDAGQFVAFSDMPNAAEIEAEHTARFNAELQQGLKMLLHAFPSDIQDLRVDRDLGERLIGIHTANAEDPNMVGDSIGPLIQFIQSLDELYRTAGLGISSADVARLAAADIQDIYDVGGDEAARSIAVKAAQSRHLRAAAWAVSELERRGLQPPLER